MHLALRGLATLAVAATVSTLAVGVAEAAPTGRVVAATQKMTGPSLKTTQVGTYPAGARVTLQCYERGQSVKGALSKYHGNGGWDDLWYKTSDGVYVADIDIETGSNNPVTGKCGDAPAAQPAPVQGAAPAGLAAIAGRTKGRSTGQVNVIAAAGYTGECTYGAQEMIHRNAGYYIPALNGPARTWAGQARADGWTVTSSPQARSVVVFAPGVNQADGTNGHVAWVNRVEGNTIYVSQWNYAGKRYETQGTYRHMAGMQYILIP
ncbi:CHAP domain-containing protein [Tsukamurella sp. NPDC003166]|uniref:CHAP domain-containing protein n=1 Tax=Tsukamurella sp. NPDC003166 TaxID=3154444 RepID=UPI0033A4138F